MKGKNIFRGKLGFLIAVSAVMLIALSFNGCCSCGAEKEENVVEGIMGMIGHEPFTKLALNIDDKLYYVLDCSDEMKKEFMKSQGKLYKIQYSRSYVKEELPYIVVENAVLLKERTKK